MDEQAFQKFCAEHEADARGLASRMVDNSTLASMMHSALGVVTEAGEIADIIKKEYAYGKTVDPTHMKEEIGDVLHYLTYFCRIYGFTFEDCMAANVRKLKVRYPDGFSIDKAVKKDREAERIALG